MTNKLKFAVAATLMVTGLMNAPANAAEENAWPPTRADQIAPFIKSMPQTLSRNLKTFDDLDFRVYTNQQWQDLHKSHAADIVVHYPDGHTTKGIPDHIKELEFMWTFAPDNRITEHPIRFGTADATWTAVAGFLDGTFTKPMALPDGTVIPPTGKTYHLPMATLGHWNKQGTMDEEYLYWDNATLMKQLGVTK
ncbi:ester cyclase [Burkholderia cepacia]|uniref:Polyketide cyclase n=1 Tax=Burkholderia cepacia GG4 TaxID=1009846 RepID=A0A9W3K5S2_BURCE|nr:ester cyclase [Burkholderia cepacia]AFQ51599.1 hypothetical protein GEM_5214 [Burkholderia cepacia GG4]